MHEHLETFKLINMNGRVYDPVLGRFLSPDNYVQDAGSTQAYNRYTYCLNNPLQYTDPSGWITAEDYWANISHILRSNAYPYGAKIGRFGEIQKFNTPEDAFFAASEYLEQFNAWDRTFFRSYTHYASWFNSKYTTAVDYGKNVSSTKAFFTKILAFLTGGKYVSDGGLNRIVYGSVSLQNPYSQSGAKVYIETEGIGHAYIEIKGTVFSFGRYDGSFSPALGEYGPIGRGILMRYKGHQAQDYITKNTLKYKTNVYEIKSYLFNENDTYNYLNNLYWSGKENKSGGREVGIYSIFSNNCATTVCDALNYGGFIASPLNAKSPAELNANLKILLYLVYNINK